MTEWFDWIRAHQSALWWLAAGSVVMFTASLVLVPVVVARIPADYFAHQKRPPSSWAAQHLVIRAIVIIIKNVVGFLLVVAGIVMLVLPGQGVISIVAGITLLDFPGKFGLERWLVSRRPVLRAINWMREQVNQAPLVVAD